MNGASDDNARLPSRRSLFIGTAGVAALVAVGGASAAWGLDSRFVRPPGAQDEVRFQSLCIRCDRCRSACPTGAIGTGQLENGLLNVRTPVMSFKRGACDFCEGRFLCVANCPTEAIAPGFDPACNQMGVAVVDRSECLLYRTGSHLCSKQCIAACAYDALSYDDNSMQLLVDAKQCNGCGACEFACPSASYAAYTASGKRGINVEVSEVAM